MKIPKSKDQGGLPKNMGKMLDEMEDRLSRQGYTVAVLVSILLLSLLIIMLYRK